MATLGEAANRGESQRGSKDPDEEIPSNKDEKQTTTRYAIDLPDDLHHKIKVQTATERRSMKVLMIEALMIEALERYLARQ